MFNFKVVFLGEGTVGKTSILLRYTKNIFDEKQRSTQQVSFINKQIVIENVKAGQEKYHSLAPIYYRDAKGIVLVYDITDYDSFERVQKWITEINKFCKDPPKIIVVGNKIDLHSKRRVEKTEAEDFSKKRNLLFLETSAKANLNIQRIFLLLVKELLKNEGNNQSNPQNQGLKIVDSEDTNEGSWCCGGGE